MQASLLIAICAPLAGTLLLIFFGKSLFKRHAHIVAILAVAISFAASTRLFLYALEGGRFTYVPFQWIQMGSMDIPFGLTVDPLSALFLFFITGVGTLIHIYSAGYMHGDKGYPRYFAFLNLFVFCMILLVLANNFLLLFLFWEGVGLCSYLLIGFWFHKPTASAAAKKAFLVNRVGDVCFLAGILFIALTFHTLEFDKVFLMVPGIPVATLTLIALLLFAGATGKSAQIPLFTWLPDAMEGPTPVSALIHAATMVTAGVYMIARCFPLFVATPGALHVVAWVGALTAFFAATIAMRQNDIKRVLAYSTISQLGYMFLALGLLLPAAALFHLVTHAFFKALLFLGAGSVMHGLANETDIRKMGGLAKRMKWTALTFLIGSLALAGVPPLSGFFSKEEILKGAFSGGHTVLGVIALVTAALTAFYIFRVYFLVFHAKEYKPKGSRRPAHESGPAMVVPLIVLSLLSIVAGGWNAYAGSFSLHHLFSGTGITDHGHHAGVGWVLWASIIAAAAGIALSWSISLRGAWDPERIRAARVIGRIFERKYWVDEIYDTLFVKSLSHFSRYCRVQLDEAGIDGGVNWVRALLSSGSTGLRRFQAGSLQGYLAIMISAIVVVLAIILRVGT